MAEQGEQVEEADDNSDEENKDIKEISFLKQFPNLSIFFNDNQSLIKKKGKTKGFRLNTGGWVEYWRLGGTNMLFNGDQHDPALADIPVNHDDQG